MRRTGLRRIGAGAALVGLLVMAAPGAQASHSVTRAYAGNHDPFVHTLVWWSLGLERSVMCAPMGATAGVGGACFDRPASARRMVVDVNDASTLPVTATIMFRDAAGRRVGKNVTFCDRRSARLPSTARQVVVTASAYQTACTNGIPATSGTIRATFR